MCFMDEINLQIIYERQGEQKLADAIVEDRKCPAWYAYMPGLSPQEHYDELVMQRLEADRRAYEARTEESRRRYEERMAKDSEADRRQFEIANQERNRTLIIASILVGVIIGLAQILAALVLNHESFTDQIMRRLFGQ